MGVLTGFHRVKAETIKMLEANPELMDWLFGYSADAHAGEKLGFGNGSVPPYLNIDKSWDEILIILSGTDQRDAYRALDIPLWEDYDGCEEIRLFPPDSVRSGLEILETLNAEWLRREAMRRELRTYDGDPIEQLLDDALEHLERLKAFWRETAERGEAIVSETG
jgi:hypothetical protein